LSKKFAEFASVVQAEAVGQADREVRARTGIVWSVVEKDLSRLKEWFQAIRDTGDGD
jgi:hypothetical protein